MMDAAAESCVPPGFRFHPTDEELVGYYLRKKVASQKIDLDVIREIDLYRIEPWDLQDKCGIGYSEQNEWYFFSHKDKKYPTGTRTNRATMAGFWKATGRDKAVFDNSKLIGMRKTLVFYKGRAPNGQKSDWIMHEYRLESQENAPPQEEGWVVCRAFKKRTTTTTTTATTTTKSSAEGWDSAAFYYDESSSAAEVGRCKEELEGLPQLESPVDMILANRSDVENSVTRIASTTKKARDWRDLDRFVASQLSQEADDSDLGLLLLQTQDDHEPPNYFTDHFSDSDFGFSIFDKS